MIVSAQVTRYDRRLASECGAASVVIVGLLAAVLLVVSAAVSVLSLLPATVTAANAADAAALAGADVLAGVVSGEACEIAERAASLGGATLESCTIDGPVVEATTSLVVLGLPVIARSRAGPPGWE
ncbi:hypothetical protein MN032_18655 [Agromyces atrinae]|uniref:Rv3654c family TadE-like protein n=1 Tax=Agromyces atrinae TaxID=592376 RepID=UPI001F58DFA3|nr:Rv3654c family TadE-like protein [Agromyces atrinae]MCI2959660.1 hypothetical protein [Agromyces atrinae]MCI2959675.1 hypothetical protein [Agromyces atrinae]MCI2959707.1 hypothetical protein [Agromyces atrinae]